MKPTLMTTGDSFSIGVIRGCASGRISLDSHLARC